MNVLSLFDGMSCGQLALKKANIKVSKYYASEIDKYAIKVTQHNFPNTIQVGDIRNLKGSDFPKIDLLMGGSPCQGFSFAGKRKGMSTKCAVEITTLKQYLEFKNDGFEFDGQSYLFWEFVRLLNEIKPRYFLLENVLMGQKWETIITRALEIKPIKINSALVSAQNRVRLYWTNIGAKPMGFFNLLENTIPQPENKNMLLKDILENDVEDKYVLKGKRLEWWQKNKNKLMIKKYAYIDGEKSIPLLARNQASWNEQYITIHSTAPRSSKTRKGGTGHLSKNDNKTYCLNTETANVLEIHENKQTQIRRLTPVECERLQTVSDNYTAIVSDTQRYKMLGNGWTVDVIAHIFSYINI